MILSRVSIQRPVLASMMSLALVLFGFISMTRLPVRELPDIDPPIVSVSTVYPGANAEVVETEVTERLEEAINNIEGIKTLTSQSREQVSNITIEFDLSRNIDLAAQDVRDRVARVRGRLPESIREPIVAKQDADAFPVLWIAMNSDRYTPLELTTLAERQIKNRLQTVTGVSSVMIGGEKRFAMRLWLDAERMAAHQVTVLDVQRALREQNVELPSGRVENLQREMTIQTLGELKTVDEYNALVIRTDGIRIVRLRDIGEAREGVEEERSLARYNGRTCIFLGIVKQSKANTVEVANGIKAELELIRGILPLGVALDVAFDESVYVQKAIEEVWLTLAIAFGLVMLVIYLFLRDLRSTLVPMAAIPVSIVATFAILQWMGYSINILTMLALVLAIGVVVDDAIVVLENIYRHIEHGMRPMQAAFKAMDEISFAIIAITVSLVAVFLPLAFQTSTAGRLFVEFAVAVAGSVVVSAFVALSLSPMMAARILKPIDRAKKHNFVVRGFERLLTGVNHGYRGALGWSLSHRWVVLLVGLGTLGLMVVFYRALDKDFLPEEDKGRLIAFVVAPEGATIEYTDRMMREMEGILRDTPEVLSYGCVLAPGFSGPGQANSGILFVRLQEGRRRSVQDVVNGPDGLRARLFREVEGAIANVQIPKAIGRGFSAPFQLVIQGQDLDVMDRYLRRSLGELRETGFLLNLRSSFEFNKPELRVEINRDRAAALGVSVEDISRTMQMLFGGLDLSRIKLDGKEYEVIAQLDRYSRLTPQDLDRLYVRNSRGELIQLSSLVSSYGGRRAQCDRTLQPAAQRDHYRHARGHAFGQCHGRRGSVNPGWSARWIRLRLGRRIAGSAGHHERGVVRVGVGAGDCLHGFGGAVREPGAPVHGDVGGAPGRRGGSRVALVDERRRAGRFSAGGFVHEHQSVQSDRLGPVGRPGHQELDSPGRVRQSPAHPGRFRPRRHARGRHHPAAANPDDRLFHHRWHFAHRDRFWSRGRKPPSDGHGGGGRIVDQHVFDLAGHSRGLHGAQRFGGLCPASEDGDRGCETGQSRRGNLVRQGLGPNPKSESRNPKQIRISNGQNPKPRRFEIAALGFRICFGVWETAKMR